MLGLKIGDELGSLVAGCNEIFSVTTFIGLYVGIFHGVLGLKVGDELKSLAVGKLVISFNDRVSLVTVDMLISLSSLGLDISIVPIDMLI